MFEVTVIVRIKFMDRVSVSIGFQIEVPLCLGSGLMLGCAILRVREKVWLKLGFYDLVSG